MAARHLITGRQGEDAAEELLRASGYVIVARNWRRESLELDFVAVDPAGALVFVEVKTRAAGGLQSPAEALGRVKRSRLVRAASLYLSEQGCWDKPCRFDLICVTHSQAGRALEHHTHVFDLSQALGDGHTAWQPW